MESKDSAYFFEPIFCGDCYSKERLLIHKYKNEIKCADCVDKIFRSELKIVDNALSKSCQYISTLLSKKPN